MSAARHRRRPSTAAWVEPLIFLVFVMHRSWVTRCSIILRIVFRLDDPDAGAVFHGFGRQARGCGPIIVLAIHHVFLSEVVGASRRLSCLLDTTGEDTVRFRAMQIDGDSSMTIDSTRT